MSKPVLSIIIPCYNCEQTLEEALMSILNSPPEHTFEIIMVDDKSTDSTWELLQKLQKVSSVIKIQQNQQNKGGGATRNTAIRESSGDLIFCLDSDDLVTPGMLNKMIVFQKEHNLDGVGVHYSKKFKGGDSKNIFRTDIFSYTQENVSFPALFEANTNKMNPLYSVFLYTREVFEITGGYPENHGFDTQGFAFRFLANGFIARACPDTTYLHRINFHKSYYTREYESGEINHNWLKIYEEFFYLWKPDVQTATLDFPLNRTDKNFHSHFSVTLPLDPDKKHFIAKNTKQLYKDNLTPESLSPMDAYWLGCMEQDNEESLNYFLKTLRTHKSSLVLHHIVEQLSFLTGMPIQKIFESVDSIENKTLQGSKAALLERLIRKSKRVIQRL